MKHMPVSRATQEKINDDVVLLSLDDILPEDFHHPSPDDLAVTAFWNSRPLWSPEDTTKQTACLLAWEKGQISGADAFGYLDSNDLLDHDAILMCWLGYLRAKAEGGELV